MQAALIHATRPSSAVSAANRTSCALLRAIQDTPQDDAPRLIYADWLDEHGDSPRSRRRRNARGWASPRRPSSTADRRRRARRSPPGRCPSRSPPASPFCTGREPAGRALRRPTMPFEAGRSMASLFPIIPRKSPTWVDFTCYGCATVEANAQPEPFRRGGPIPFKATAHIASDSRSP